MGNNAATTAGRLALLGGYLVVHTAYRRCGIEGQGCGEGFESARAQCAVQIIIPVRPLFGQQNCGRAHVPGSPSRSLVTSYWVFEICFRLSLNSNFKALSASG